MNAMKIELSKSLIEFSDGKLSDNLANNIADKIIDNINLSNSAIMHKRIQ